MTKDTKVEPIAQTAEQPKYTYTGLAKTIQEQTPGKKKYNAKYERDRDRQQVRGMFKYYEVPGGRLEFCTRFHKEDEIEKWDMYDGMVYTVPLGVAKHLNKNGWIPVHMHAVDENGKSIAKIGQKVRRYGFQSLEFIDEADLTEVGAPLITVESPVNANQSW